MIFKLYLATIIMFYIALFVSVAILSKELKRNGLKMPKSSLIMRVKNWSSTIFISFIPVVNVILAMYFFLGMDEIYDKLKSKCITDDTEKFNTVSNENKRKMCIRAIESGVCPNACERCAWQEDTYK